MQIATYRNTVFLWFVYFTGSYKTMSRPWISFASAVTCTRRPEIKKVLFPVAISRASRVGDVDRFGDVIRYNCKRGERFMDGTTTKWIKCNESGLWNDTDVDNCASTTPFRPSYTPLVAGYLYYSKRKGKVLYSTILKHQD